MSFVVAIPELVQGAAQDLAGLQTSLAEAAEAIAGPTTGVLPAAADEVSAAISTMFGNFGQQFQFISAQAQAFHAQFVSLMNSGIGAYIGTEFANAEQAVSGLINGGGATAGATAAAGSQGSLLGGLFGGGGGGLGGAVSALTGGAGSSGSVLGGILGTGSGGGLVGGLLGTGTGGPATVPVGYANIGAGNSFGQAA